MCWKAVSHGGMIHDRRPIVADPSNPARSVVNSYADPIPCPCGMSEGIKPFLRCEYGHDCCRTCSRTVRCAMALAKAGSKKKTCDLLVTYHTYEPRSLVGDARFPEGGGGLSPEDEGWHPLPRLDGRDRLLEVARGLADAEAEFARTRADYYSVEHAMACRVLSDWEHTTERDYRAAKKLYAERDRDFRHAVVDFKNLRFAGALRFAGLPPVYTGMMLQFIDDAWS